MFGYFGWRCSFKCRCQNGEICDDVTGRCPSSCPGERWGVGCLLSTNCTYNDPKGRTYAGRRSSTDINTTCLRWTDHGWYMPAKDQEAAECVTGRFGVNCEKECHCSSGTEDCQSSSGRCTSGCAPHFTGPTCQDMQHLPTFTLSVGNIPNIVEHTKCASHNGEVAAGETVSESCTAVGRYLSFRRREGYKSRLTALCEVAVIGHRYIYIPEFQPSELPTIDYVTYSSAVVSWSKAGNIPSGVDSHYYYVLRWKADTLENTKRVEQPVDNIRIEAHITGLMFNTNYSVSVEPYRQDSGQQEGGIATGVTTFKTSCIGPHPTIIEEVKQSTPDMTTNASTVVQWKAITESGCDKVVAVRVWYKRQTSITWKYIEPDTVNQTHVTISDLSRDVYTLKLTATNNENITSTSPSLTASLVIAPSTTPTVDSPDMKQMTNPGLSKGASAGIAVAVIIVIVVVVVVLLVVVRKACRCICVQTGSEQDNRAFEAAEEEEDDKADEEEEEPDNGLMLNHDEETGVIYANTQQMSRSVAIGDIAAYVKDKRSHDGFTKEHEDLPSGVHAKCDAAKKSQNKSQNRFVNILAYDHTRVVLSVTSGQRDYINANYIMVRPRDWTTEDMWRMVWQEKSNTIVMLTNLYEMAKEKCSRYWPEKGKVQSWGTYITEAISEDRFAGYVIREFMLKNEETRRMRRIRQLHFTAWPDKGTPEYAYPLLAFHRKVNSFDSVRRGPLVVHCSAGVGRTGTFIAIDILIQQAAAEGKVDVFQCVNLLRTQRMDMVQTVSQYVYVHQALIESREVTVIPSYQLRQTFDELRLGNKFVEQFEGYKKQDAFILTQSPMTTTVVDLWRLLYDHESRTVVMLDDCDVTDDCAIYWPNKKAQKQQYGPFEVELLETNFSENSNVTQREFKLTKSGRSDDSTTVVKQFQLNKNGWHQYASLPTDKMVLPDLLDMVEKWQQQSGNQPITIHCSDGASRCGLLCAASYVLEHLKVEQEVDIFHAVQHIRTTRPQLITDLDQYRFLFEVALAYMSQFDTYANFQ
ncbi:Receptor-type tyrosine-protein phosphatase kappa [Lamellibrachia satsuma]|nr:Receptor-type tyrosine-protein phosphatase kappa [Lamellibrachia satsuma]